MKQADSLIDSIRKLIKQKQTFKQPNEMYNDLGCKNNNSRKSSVRKCISNLVKKGELERTGYGYRIKFLRYRSRGSQANKFWDSIRCLRTWTISDIAQVTNLSQSYIRLIISRYSDFIVDLGWIQSFRSQVKSYRIKDKDVFFRPGMKSSYQEIIDYDQNIAA